MNKAYLLVPLIATLVFGGYYWNFKTGYNQEIAAKQLKAKQAHEAKLVQEQLDREEAIRKANAAVEARKQQKEEKIAREKKAQEERTQAVEEQRLAQAEQHKLDEQVYRLKNDVKMVEKEIAEIEAQKKQSVAEEAFQQTYVQKAKANVRALTEALEKIETADKILKERAAAAAKKP